MEAAVRAYLALAAWSEGTSTSPATKNDGYDVIVTGIDGKPEIFQSYADHPFAFGRPAKIIREAPGELRSTAAGRYQILLKWWRAYKAMLNLPDFTPQSQDAVAIRQLKERGAIDLILQDKIPEAIAESSHIWASFPGTYSQGNGPHSVDALIEKYHELLGVMQ